MKKGVQFAVDVIKAITLIVPTGPIFGRITGRKLPNYFWIADKPSVGGTVVRS